MNIIDIAIAKQLAGGGGGSGTDSYNDLSNLPKINDVTLSGNKSSSALGLQSEITSDSKLASDLVDDTNQDNKFVTSAEKTTWNGKQNAIDADHKINADYVDDSTSTNKFVTASDKETWNAKQNAIDNSHKLSSDLVDDANHTNKFVTSTEKQTWNAKQNAIDADHKLSSSLVSFSEAEAAAIASGIDSSKVGQISTNQTNILYGLNTGVKNILSLSGVQTINGITYTPQEDGTVKATGTATANAAYYLNDSNKYIPNVYGGYKFHALSNGTDNIYALVQYSNDGSQWAAENAQKTSEITVSSNYPYVNFVLMVKNGTTPNQTFAPMLCTPEAWAQSHDFQPYALPNYDLTYLQAEDRAALAEEIDAGAKNKAPTASIVKTVTTPSFTPIIPCSFPAGTYHVKFNYTMGNMGTFCLKKSDASTTLLNLPTLIPTGTGTYEADFTINEACGGYNIYGENTANLSNIMICTKAAFGMSQKFVPYRPPYDQMIPHVYSATTDLNNLLTTGVYRTSNLTSTQHAPENGYFTLIVMQIDTSTIQLAYRTNKPEIFYQRHYISNTWSSWYRFT
ncbi:MAG: hypothetical protein IIW48_07690, partial [Clostridia bacterium]|nr:hypothetical protein [Clostridia bacterium]